MVSSKSCNNAYPGMITDAMTCFGKQNLCKIGQGAPAECNGELHGMFSWDHNPETNVGVFAKICIFNDWIESTMASF